MISEEIRLKISKSKMGNKCNKGKKHSPEACKRRSAAMKRYWYLKKNGLKIVKKEQP